MCVGGSSDENGPGMIWGASLAKKLGPGAVECDQFNYEI